LYKFKEWEELTITDNFLFQKVMQNDELCKTFLSKLLKRRIIKIDYIESEKTIDLTFNNKSVRLDMFVTDENGNVFNIEMQTTDASKKFLPKRARYYGSMIDLNTLSKGEYYKNLKESFVIFICTFDPFGYNNKIYTFRNTCEEVKKLRLKDETTKIFLNACGKKGRVDSDINNFLRYISGRTSKGDFVKAIKKEVEKVKLHKEMRAEYMTLMLELQDQRYEGIEEGIEKGIEKGIERTAFNMLKENVPLELIAKVTNLPLDRIRAIGNAN